MFRGGRPSRAAASIIASLLVAPASKPKGRAGANPHGLKHVLHADGLASEAGRQIDAYLPKLRRPEAHHRIPRKAKALARDSYQHAQLPVAVLVVKDRKRIAPRGEAG